MNPEEMSWEQRFWWAFEAVIELEKRYELLDRKKNPLAYAFDSHKPDKRLFNLADETAPRPRRGGPPRK